MITETRNFTVRRANVAPTLAALEHISADRPIDAARAFAVMRRLQPGARIEVQQNGHKSHRAYVIHEDGAVKNA